MSDRHNTRRGRRSTSRPASRSRPPGPSHRSPGPHYTPRDQIVDDEDESVGFENESVEEEDKDTSDSEARSGRDRPSASPHHSRHIMRDNTRQNSRPSGNGGNRGRGRGAGRPRRGGSRRGSGSNRGAARAAIPIPRSRQDLLNQRIRRMGVGGDSDEEDEGDDIESAENESDEDSEDQRRVNLGGNVRSDDEEDGGDGDGDGGGGGGFGDGGIGPGMQAPPAPVEEYDLVYDTMLARSPFYRTVVRQRAFGRMPKELPKPAYVKDPLLGCRLQPDAFPNTPELRQRYLEEVTNERFWGLINEQASILAKLEELPRRNTDAVIDFLGYTAVIVDFANEYELGPERADQEEQALRVFGKITTLLWIFYLYVRPTESNTDKKMSVKLKTTVWIMILSLRKMVVEKFQSAHWFLLKAYHSFTLGEFIACDKESGYNTHHMIGELDDDSISGGRDAPRPVLTTNTAWFYLRCACVNHFTGSTRPVSAEVNGVSYNLPNSSSVISQPDARTLNPASDHHSVGSFVAPRAYSNKVSLVGVFKANDPALNVKLNEMPLDVFLHVLMSIHSLWINLEWTPISEMLILTLWYHFSRLVVEGPKVRRLINVLEHAKRKPIYLKPSFASTATADASSRRSGPIAYKPLSHRFIRDMANVFVNHLETTRTYYTLMERTLVRHPRAPYASVACFNAFQKQKQIDEQRAKQNKDREEKKPTPIPKNESFKPIGFFDTLLHPECKQFLPSIRLQGQSDETVVKCMRRLHDEVEGVDSGAAIKYYYNDFIKCALIPGSVTAVISKMPGMVPKPSVVLEVSNSQILAPVGELSFQTHASVICLAFLRPGDAFQRFLTNPKHARLALQAYDSMITSMLISSSIKIERLNRHQHRVMTTGATSRNNHTNNTTTAEEYLSRILKGEISDIRNEDLEALVEYQLTQSGDISNYAKRRPLSNLVSVFKRLRKRTNQTAAQCQEGGDEEMGEAEDAAEADLPVEVVHDMNKIFITCTDAFGAYICLERERIYWPTGVRTWPRVLKVRGENWIFEQESNFFLRTTDPLEALHAWYIAALYKFGREWKMTSGFLSMFERMVGETYREALFR